jgi:hypothetical protein
MKNIYSGKELAEIREILSEYIQPYGKWEDMEALYKRMKKYPDIFGPVIEKLKLSVEGPRWKDVTS